jgi:acetoin utilization deacetylase AcuC-like enzyme
MTTLIFTHPDFRLHDTGMGHPESPTRIDTVWDVLGSGDFRQLEQREAPEATVEQLAAVHKRAYVDAVLAAVPKQGRVHLDPDTVLSATSRSAILRASGAVCAAVDAVLGGEGVDNAFCAVRPCGHHAEPARAMGFCVFNNIAVGAEHARRKHGVKKVAIVDFDVHHGNGTQAMVEDEPDLFFASTHEWPFYPGTGARDECGNHDNVVNVPLAAFAGSAEFRRGMKDFILPAVESFAPDLLMISAGFDAHRRDPLAHINLEAEDFAWATRELMAVARRHCNGRIVSVLEGGYSMDGLAESLAAHVRELMAA